MAGRGVVVGGGGRRVLAALSHTCRDAQGLLFWRRYLATQLGSDDKIKSSFAYCMETVRKYDYEHYLCALLLPKPQRAAAFAFRAFNVETAQVVDQTRLEPTLSKLRFEWWREAVEDAFKGRPPEHPVARALATVTASTRLTKRWFSRVIDARERDANSTEQPPTVKDLERYAENTMSALLYLTLEASGVRDANADHAASHIGKADGVALLLRATPYHSAQRRTYIPASLTTEYSVSQEEVFRGEFSEGMADAILEVAGTAKAHLDKARAMASTVPKEALPVLLPAVPCGLYLQALEKHGFNVFTKALSGASLGVSPMWLQLQLQWHAFRRTY
eukprot:jgi/Chlat1/7431/Chrsp6S07451